MQTRGRRSRPSMNESSSSSSFSSGRPAAATSRCRLARAIGTIPWRSASLREDLVIWDWGCRTGPEGRRQLAGLRHVTEQEILAAGSGFEHDRIQRPAHLEVARRHSSASRSVDHPSFNEEAREGRGHGSGRGSLTGSLTGSTKRPPGAVSRTTKVAVACRGALPPPVEERQANPAPAAPPTTSESSARTTQRQSAGARPERSTRRMPSRSLPGVGRPGRGRARSRPAPPPAPSTRAYIVGAVVGVDAVHRRRARSCRLLGPLVRISASAALT